VTVQAEHNVTYAHYMKVIFP